jgi:hypothetical protein
MSIASGPNSVVNGLLFDYDMSNTQRSWKGKPTENLLSLAGGNPIIERSGTSYPNYQVDITSLVQARWSASNNYLSYSLDGKRDYAVGGTAGAGDGYPCGYVFFSDWSWAASGGPASYDWTSYSNSAAMPNPAGKGIYFAVYHMNAGNPGKSYSKNHQVEFSPFSTPLVDGTRSNDQAILDLANRSTATASNLIYASDNTFSFDGPSASSVSVPLTTAFNKLAGTINMWVYPTAYDGGNGYFVNRDDSGANAGDWLWIGPYSGTFYFRLGDGSSCCSNDLSVGGWAGYVPLNTWTNVCFTWKSGGTSTIYINGSLLTSRAISAIPSTNPSTNGRIGLGHANNYSFYTGKLPSAQIYNRQLTDQEVAQNFNAYRGRYGI